MPVSRHQHKGACAAALTGPRPLRSCCPSRIPCNPMPWLESRPLLIGMVALRFAIAIIAIEELASEPVRDGDVIRFHTVGNAPGTPYRDYDIEYAPLEFLGIVLVAGTTVATTGIRLVLLAFVADLAAAAGVGWGWGRRTATAYLLLGAPLLLFLYLRFDPVVVALGAWAAAAARRRHQTMAGIGLGAAWLMKLWPAVLVPALLVAGRRRATIVAVVVATVGGGTWLVLTSPSAPMQVLTFRGATGWGAESPIGTLVWLITGGPTRLENGAPRVGTVPAWATPVLAVALAVTIIVIYARTRGKGIDAFGTPLLGAMGALLTFSPLFSLQYAAWLLPWAAIAHDDGDRWALPLTGLVSTITAGLFVFYAADLLGWARFILVVRAAAVVALILSACLRDDMAVAPTTPG
jgi:hypothetical protein